MSEDSFITQWWFKWFIIPLVATLFIAPVLDVTNLDRFFPSDFSWALSRGLAICLVWVTSFIIVLTYEEFILGSNKNRTRIIFSMLFIAFCFGTLNKVITSNSFSIAIIVGIYCSLVFSGQIAVWIQIFEVCSDHEPNSRDKKPKKDDFDADLADVAGGMVGVGEGLAQLVTFMLFLLFPIISGIFTSFILWAAFNTDSATALGWGVSVIFMTLIVGCIFFYIANLKKPEKDFS